MADNAIGPRHFVPLISIALLLAVLLGRAQSTQFQLKKQLTWCEGNSASKVQLSESVDTRLQRASTRRENSHDNGVEESHHGLADCLRKLSVSIRIDNNEETDLSPRFLIVDSVYDSIRHEEVALYNPLIVRIKQNPLLLAYPFKHIFSVNNKPYEQISHRDTLESDKTCSTLTTFGTCYHDNPTHANSQIQAGFCCTCAGGETEEHVQIRGGQDCSGGNSHTSIHCLKFDPLWYSVNSLSAPFKTHSLSVGAYMEFEREGNSGEPRSGEQGERNRHWAAMTGAEDMVLGTENRTTWGAGRKVHATYTDLDRVEKVTWPLDEKRQFVLVPEPIVGPRPLQPAQAHKQLKGGVSEYLVINKTLVDAAGDTCDKVGVSHAGFVGQTDRCQKTPQSCLRNQPADFWLEDKEKQKGDGTNFLGFKGPLAEPSVVQKRGESDRKYLMFQYGRPHSSHLHLEVNADKLVVIHKGSHGILTESQVSSEVAQAEVRTLVYNSGLVSDTFSVRLTACAVLNFQPEVHQVTVGPHQADWVVMTLPAWKTMSTTENATCTIELLNSQHVIIARRQLVVRAIGRCYCIGHCECKCASSDGQHCKPLGRAAYRQAGFRGATPRPLHRPLISLSAAQVVEIVFLIVFLLLLIGLLKMFAGVFMSVEVGQFGLNLFRDPKCSSGRGRQMSLWREMGLNAVFLFYIPFIPVHWAAMEIARGQRDSRARYHQLLPESPTKRPPPSPKRFLGEQPLFYQQHGEADSRGLLPNVPPVSPLASSVQGSPRRDKRDKDTVIQQFRKQKKSLQRQSESSAMTEANEGDQSILNDSQRLDADLSVLESLGEKDRGFIERITEGGVTVFYNFVGTDIHLRRPGERFSLCGHLRQSGRVFKFTLGPNLTQLYETHKDQARPLLTPLPINPKFFQRSLGVPEVLLRITEEPESPCLNFVFDKREATREAPGDQPRPS